MKLMKKKKLFTSCCYTSDQGKEVLDMEPTVEEENVIWTIDEDAGLPPSNYQEENEGQKTTTETPEHLGDALHGTLQ